jgi:nucleoside-diphosphate-sugar epimerase
MLTSKEVGNALVTGGTGFIGSNLIKRLIDEGWRVHIIIRPTSDLVQLNEVIGLIHIHIYDGSIECLLEIFKLAQPTIVLHLASLFLAQHTPKDITPMIQSNLVFATQLVEAMIVNKVYKLINTGTSWQHYENKDYSPVCLYAATKQAFESILQFYLETTPLQTITLKLFDSYGAKDPRLKLFSLLEKVANQQENLAMSPGKQKINLVYIEDIIDAYFVAIKKLMPGLNNSHESYAVCSSSTQTLHEIVSIYEEGIGGKLPITWGERPYREREVMETWSRGVTIEGWQPQVSLREGIRKVRQINCHGPVNE